MIKNVKYMIMVFVLLLINSCRCSKGISHNSEKGHLAKADTVIIVDNEKIDSLFKLLKAYEDRCVILKDSVCFLEDSVAFYRDSIRYEDYINGRRIEKIKYYISICEKNSNNKKYFFGWIRRAVSD